MSTTIAQEETCKDFYKLAAVIAELFAAHQALIALVGSLLASDWPTRNTLTDLAVTKELAAVEVPVHSILAAVVAVKASLL